MPQRSSRRAQRVDVPEMARTADRPAAPDYAAAFAVAVDDADRRSPELWARLIFEGAPTALRWFVLIGWRSVLWLRLGPASSPEHVLGWRIVGGTAEAITLTADSTLITAEKIVHIEPARVTVTTSVHYRRGSGRLIWTALSPIHHRVEPLLLSRAARPPR